MTRDNKTKLTKNNAKNEKNEKNKYNKKDEDLKNKKKKNNHSDSDDDYFSESDSDYDNDELDVHEYRKFLAKIFPSKHIDNKIKAGEKIKKIENDIKKEKNKKLSSQKENNKKKDNKKQKYDSSEDEYWETGSSSSEEEIKKKGKKIESDSDYEEDEDSSYDESDENDDDYEEEEDNSSEYEEEDEDEEEDDDENDVRQNKKEKTSNEKGKLNIILTLEGLNKDYDEEYDEDTCSSDYEDSSYVTEDEDEPISSEDENEKKKSKNNKNQKATESITQKTKSTKKSPQKTKDIGDKDENNNVTSNNSSTENNELVLSKLKELYNSDKNNKVIQECIQVCEKNIKQYEIKKNKKEKKYKDRNMRIFKKIIKDKNAMNDYSFYEKLDVEGQKKIIKELREINKITRIEKPYRITLLESNIPSLFKGAAMKKINSLRNMEPGSGEFYKIKNWVDTFMRIPFENYNKLPININDGVDKCHEFMETAKQTLDDAVYGLNDAKMQIMQMLGQLITNPNAIGCAIAIHGPAGTGKTSVVKEGISKILNRPFAFIALGGATDSSFLEGHSYTYEGSTWGKIVQILIDSKCMNPVIYFDELDKISDTPRGEEITGILTHLTDTSQNSQFHDKYFSEINFDLSKCLFIFSYNDESKVNPILKDRMYRIQTKGYNQKQKTIISNSYLLPKISEQVKFDKSEIIIPDDSIHYIIDNYCDKEDGVRNLKRCLEIIYTKLNLYRLMKPNSNMFEEEMSLKVEFPFLVTKEIVDKLIKKDKSKISALYSMYI
jgi:ATP-dependent Lon protease